RELMGKHTCERLFIAVLGLTENEFARIVQCIVDDEPLVANRKGCVGLPSDNTCRAIARIAIDTKLYGQYNPMSESILLPRGVSKSFYVRSNARFSTLDEDRHLAKYVGLTVRRRGGGHFHEV
ncbi:hypothetical protein PMAYCL1PPCAC_23976, partial [Pristionchus mayeri]